ncbi:MAG: hypothetical protein HY648_04980 [Acidobacteria bacterium]|nr:hypothetical protein [Acidobacteriota bacterium]
MTDLSRLFFGQKTRLIVLCRAAVWSIPVEYVHAVLEVKARLSAQTAKDALDHLLQLSPIMSRTDDPNERCKLYLPPTFGCGLVFFELSQKDAQSEEVLQQIVSGWNLRGFLGGLVLRGEGHPQPDTARFMRVHSEKPIPNIPSGGSQSLLQGTTWKWDKIADNLYVGVVSAWAEFLFAMFAFDLLACLKGTYNRSFASSPYGWGASAGRFEKF